MAFRLADAEWALHHGDLCLCLAGDAQPVDERGIRLLAWQVVPPAAGTGLARLAGGHRHRSQHCVLSQDIGEVLAPVVCRLGAAGGDRQCCVAPGSFPGPAPSALGWAQPEERVAGGERRDCGTAVASRSLAG
ncbi:hypothetical protein D3C75_987250 [compost metagenome]